jgi:glycosyltransferase involved in cell wall biosynthesis
MPKISVVMLTFNRETLVGGMIECVLAQTFRDFEFIIVDNGSTDRSGAIADEYAARDPRIRVIHRPCGNIGSRRNVGLDAARGDFVAFVDDDDNCTPDYLQFLYDLAVDNNAEISICGATWSDIHEKRIMSPEQAIETLLWRKSYNVAFPTKLFRRDLFDNNRFLNTGKYDDIYLMPKILSRAKIIAYHGLSNYHFNRHENNNSAWTQNHSLLDTETLREYLDVYAERTAWLCEKYPKSATMWRYFEWSFMISMVEKISRLGLENCRELCNNITLQLKTSRTAFLECGFILEFEKNWVEKYI